MARTFTITLSDDLAQALTAQAERLNKSPEEIMLQVLLQQLTIAQERSFLEGWFKNYPMEDKTHKAHNFRF